jgi:Zn-finger nucleic acid-binding protein
VGTGRACSCGSCGGVWLPFGSIETVVPRLAELAEALSPAAGPGGRAVPERLKCPDCGGDMVAVRSNEVRGAALSTCLVCFSRWASGTELSKLRRRGLLSRLLGMFLPGKRPIAPVGEPGPAPAPASEGTSGEESVRTTPPGDDTRERTDGS